MAPTKNTQVVIIGGGPSGLLLGQLLHRSGVDNIVIERKDRDYVLGRIRAGVLERGMVDLMAEAGVSERLSNEGFTHDGTVIAFNNEHFRVPFTHYIDKPVTVYGQTEVTRDLYDARDKCGATTVFNAEAVTINDAQSEAPSVSYQCHGEQYNINCDFIAGCDGFHGVSRQTIPQTHRNEYEKIYPFGWLGVMSETPPVHDELVYANSPRGFALCSMRNANLSRYYLQCNLDDSVDRWTDERFWEALKNRLPDEFSKLLVTGASIEKSIAPLRSFVCEPMQWGRLFLCGDAAHIVPPTGAKGLNTAASDVHYLYQALKRYYQDNDSAGIENYSSVALARVWKVTRFSWWMTTILHRFPDQTPFDLRVQQAELAFLKQSTEAQAAMAINYVGLPY
jgi:p-hydroxybenzoate 3-monooxygenase